MIEIVNLRKKKPRHEYDVVVDRTSLFGNPFYLDKESERSLVCSKYIPHFKDMIKTDEDFRKEFISLIELYKKHNKLRLFCWCYPKQCHAETIKEALLLKLAMK